MRGTEFGSGGRDFAVRAETAIEWSPPSAKLDMASLGAIWHLPPQGSWVRSSAWKCGTGSEMWCQGTSYRAHLSMCTP